VFGAVIGLAVSWFITNRFGAESAGLYFLALSYMTFPVALCSLGLNNAGLKLVSSAFTTKNWHRIDSIFYKTTFSVFFISIITSTVIYFFSSEIAVKVFDKPEFALVLKMMSFSLIFTSIFSLHGHVIQGVRRVNLAMILMGGAHNLILLTMLAVIKTDKIELASLFYTVSASITMVVGIILWVYIRKGKADCIKNKKKTSFVSSKDLFNLALPMLVIQLIAQVNEQTGSLFLGIWGQTSDVAFFSVSIKVAALISFILLAVNRVVSPDFSALYADKKMRELKDLTRNSTVIMLIFATPIFIFCLAFPEWILSFFGGEFKEAKASLQILACGQFLYVVSGNVNMLLLMTGNEKVLRNNLIISSLFSVTIGIWLVSKFGLIGAALTTCLSLVLGNALSCYKVKKVLDINILKII